MNRFKDAPLSVIIPTLNSDQCLAACLSSLVVASVDGLIKEVIVSDGGSRDRTKEIADAFGATFIEGMNGRGTQLKHGAAMARAEWFLFLHSDTVFKAGWERVVEEFINPNMTDKMDGVVGTFHLRFDDVGLASKIVAWGANFRTRHFRMPYGDQGLLISRQVYNSIGGYNEEPLFEDVALIDAIHRAYGRNAVALLPAFAITSADRYASNGYFRRVVRNWVFMRRYRAGESPGEIIKQYEA
ncbi:MAG: TIGR04283 family arsenosugar biosynthesis glycosyltransferase [Pseudomonadota bacterium]